jgi:hypothetical protein
MFALWWVEDGNFRWQQHTIYYVQVMFALWWVEDGNFKD